MPDKRAESPVVCAATWRAELAVDDRHPIDVWRIAQMEGWRVEHRRLRAADGGLRACLIPSGRNQFSIFVDPSPMPTEQAESPLAVVAYRIAHELGHTLFYDRGAPPRRLVPYQVAEESFCDDFAACLLVPPAIAVRAATPQRVCALASRYGAPQFAVARASSLASVGVAA